MQRRQFLSLIGALFCALPVHAEQEKVWRIGYLHPGFLTNPADLALVNALKDQLRELGYVEDRNIIMDYRAAEGNNGRLATLAEQLVALKPDVIVAVATPAIAAAQAATRTIPIVMSPATDPVGSGFVKSLAHPAGNITGMANMFMDLTAKSVELLRTLLPHARKIAVLMSSNPTHPSIYEEVRATAGKADFVTTPQTTCNEPSTTSLPLKAKLSLCLPIRSAQPLSPMPLLREFRRSINTVSGSIWGAW